jgi:hypothetical protein
MLQRNLAFTELLLAFKRARKLASNSTAPSGETVLADSTEGS